MPVLRCSVSFVTFPPTSGLTRAENSCPVLSRWIDSLNICGLTALHVAVQYDALECVLALIEAGASLMVVTGSINGVEPYVRPGTTPLHMAAQNGTSILSGSFSRCLSLPACQQVAQDRNCFIIFL